MNAHQKTDFTFTLMTIFLPLGDSGESMRTWNETISVGKLALYEYYHKFYHKKIFSFFNYYFLNNQN